MVDAGDSKSRAAAPQHASTSAEIYQAEPKKRSAANGLGVSLLAQIAP
jgi:hypothetical protein